MLANILTGFFNIISCFGFLTGHFASCTDKHQLAVSEIPVASNREVVPSSHNASETNHSPKGPFFHDRMAVSAVMLRLSQI